MFLLVECFSQDHRLHGAYHVLLPSCVRLSSVCVSVALGAGVALPGGRVPLRADVASWACLPIPVSSRSFSFVMLAPYAACGGRRGDVLPQRRPVRLARSGGGGVVAGVTARGLLGERHSSWLVAVLAGVGGWISWRGSGVGGVIVWIPPVRVRQTYENTQGETLIILRLRQ